MEAKDGLEPLLAALRKHGCKEFSAPEMKSYGPVRMAEGVVPGNPTYAMPPVGSTDFDSFLAAQADVIDAPA